MSRFAHFDSPPNMDCAYEGRFSLRYIGYLGEVINLIDDPGRKFLSPIPKRQIVDPASANRAKIAKMAYKVSIIPSFYCLFLALSDRFA